MIYQYKPGRGVTGVEAQDVGEELSRIAQGDELRPRSVVEASKPKKALLHHVFEWDNEKAADEYRVHQARQIINSVLVVPEAQDAKPVQAFINVTVTHDQPERAYVPAQAVAMDPDMRDRHIAMIKSRLRNIRREYAAFTELAGIWSAIDAA